MATKIKWSFNVSKLDMMIYRRKSSNKIDSQWFYELRIDMTDFDDRISKLAFLLNFNYMNWSYEWDRKKPTTNSLLLRRLRIHVLHLKSIPKYLLGEHWMPNSFLTALNPYFTFGYDTKILAISSDTEV